MQSCQNIIKPCGNWKNIFPTWLGVLESVFNALSNLVVFHLQLFILIFAVRLNNGVFVKIRKKWNKWDLMPFSMLLKEVIHCFCKAVLSSYSINLMAACCGKRVGRDELWRNDVMVINLRLLCFRRLFSTWVNEARDMTDCLKQVLPAVCWMQYAQQCHSYCWIQEMLHVLDSMLLKAVFTVRHGRFEGEKGCWVLSCPGISHKKSQFKYIILSY